MEYVIRVGVLTGAGYELSSIVEFSNKKDTLAYLSRNKNNIPPNAAVGTYMDGSVYELYDLEITSGGRLKPGVLSEIRSLLAEYE